MESNVFVVIFFVIGLIIFFIRETISDYKQKISDFNRILSHNDAFNEILNICNGKNEEFYNNRFHNKISDYLKKIQTNRMDLRNLAKSKPILAGAVAVEFDKNSATTSYTREQFKHNLIQKAMEKSKNNVMPNLSFKPETQCKIQKITDADTFWIEILDKNDKITWIGKTRIIGIDAPEIKNFKSESYNELGADKSEKTCRELLNLEEKYLISLDSAIAENGCHFDVHRRLLCHLWINNCDLYSKEMVKKGVAKVLPKDIFICNDQIWDELYELEIFAKKNNYGFWNEINNLEDFSDSKFKNNLKFKQNVKENFIYDEFLKKEMIQLLREYLNIKSAKSKVIHNKNCQHVKRIINQNLIEFSDVELEELINNSEICKDCIKKESSALRELLT
jgi:endonuclease YncB( thermonuclease family)